MPGHARLSSSNTKRWATCPGSTAAMEAFFEGERSSSFYADQGTAAHCLGERCLREGSEPRDYEGRFIKLIEDQQGNMGTSILKKGAKIPAGDQDMVHEVDQDMYEAVTNMTDYVRRRCMELGLLPDIIHGGDAGLALAVAELVKRGTVRLEVNVVPLPDRDDTGGTGDVVIDVWPELIEVVDYKHGAGVFVPVDSNDQLRSYGLGTINEFGSGDYERVRYTICQPRHLKSPSDGIMSEEMSVTDLLGWGQWLHDRAATVDVARGLVAHMKEELGYDLERVLRNLFAERMLSVGDDGDHCTFCDLSKFCPAALAKAQELACVDFDDDPRDIEPVTSSNQLAMVLPWVPFLDKWIKSSEAGGEQLILSGGTITGFKVVRGKSNRVMKDGVEEEDLVRWLENEGVTDEGKMYNPPKPRAIRTGSQLEKLVPAKKRPAFSEEFMHKPPGKLTIAPEDDEREAVSIDPADDFPDEED